MQTGKLLVQHLKDTFVKDPFRSLHFLKLDDLLDRLNKYSRVGIYTDWGWRDINIIEAVLISVPDGSTIISNIGNEYTRSFVERNCKYFTGKKPVRFHRLEHDWLLSALHFVEDCDAVVAMTNRSNLPNEMTLIFELSHSLSTPFALYR